MSNRSTLGQLLVVGVMGALVFACTADAVQSTSTPNAALIPYNLAPGATTSSLAPVSNQTTLIMGNCTSAGDDAVGQATVLRIPGDHVRWLGIDGNVSGGISSGASGLEGTWIVSLDNSNDVHLEVGNLGGTGNGSRDTVRVHNTSNSSTRAGNATWIW